MHFILIITGLLLSAALSAVPSRRDELNKLKFAALNSYLQAKTKQDSALFLAAVGKIQETSAQVIEANNALMSAFPALPPPDVKTTSARKNWQNKMDAYRLSLTEANREIADFRPPTELNPDGIQSVAKLIRAIDKGIELHHAIAPNIR